MRRVITIQQKKAPASLRECAKMDCISKLLWKWAQNLEIVAIVLFYLNIAAGVVVGIVLASMDEEAVWFFCGSLGGVFVGYLAYVFCFVAALLIASLASIVENTRISADVAMFRATADEGTTNITARKSGEAEEGPAKSEELRKSDNSWKYMRTLIWTCRECGQEKQCKEFRKEDEDGSARFAHYCDDCIKRMNKQKEQG